MIGAAQLIKIVVSPDSFKGTVSAKEYCDITERAILDASRSLNHSVCNDIEIVKVPLADGGEGSAEAIGAKKYICEDIISGDFEKINSYFSIFNEDTVIIEIAACASLPASKLHNPELTTTYGVGELFMKAYDMGYRKFVFALGGSSTNDCACGFATAAGCDFYNSNGNRYCKDRYNKC